MILTQAESLLHNLEQAAEGISSKLSLNGGFLKLVHKLKCLGSSVSSTESDVNIKE